MGTYLTADGEGYTSDGLDGTSVSSASSAGSAAPTGAWGGLSISGALFGAWSSRKANKESARQAQIQRDWEKMMSDTAVQRRVADLKAAGLNPMLAIRGGGEASTPSVQQAPVRDVGESAMRGIATAFSAAQVAQVQANARKTNAEATILENEVPYSAQNAMWNAETVRAQFDKLSHEAHRLELDEILKGREITLKEMSIEQQEKIFPLLVRYQQLVNRATELGIPEKKATAEFFETIPESKWMQLIKDIANVSRIIGGNFSNQPVGGKVK